MLKATLRTNNHASFTSPSAQLQSEQHCFDGGCLRFYIYKRSTPTLHVPFFFRISGTRNIFQQWLDSQEAVRNPSSPVKKVSKSVVKREKSTRAAKKMSVFSDSDDVVPSSKEAGYPVIGPDGHGTDDDIPTARGSSRSRSKMAKAEAPSPPNSFPPSPDVIFDATQPTPTRFHADENSVTSKIVAMKLPEAACFETAANSTTQIERAAEFEAEKKDRRAESRVFKDTSANFTSNEIGVAAQVPEPGNDSCNEKSICKSNAVLAQDHQASSSDE